jgi:hypothetical protein
MVVHTRARELLAWLVPHTAAWPREQRHGITQHVVALALGVHDALIAARHGSPLQRGESLREADIRLDQLRQHLQLAWQWTWMSDGQYQHVCRLTAELGRLIGGWRRRASEPRS